MRCKGYAKELRNSATAANRKSLDSDAPYATIQNGYFNQRVYILIHSFRKRLADSDGISAKAAIDAFVQAGVLKDDSPAYVEETRYKQTKVVGEIEEKTVITFTEVGHDC